LTNSPMEERKEARGQITNGNRLTSGNCPTIPCSERLYFQLIPRGASDPKTTCAETECGILSLTLYKELNIPKFRFIMVYKTFESHGREPMIFG